MVSGTLAPANPKGTMSCRVQGKSMCMSVCLSVHPSPPSPSQPAIIGLWMNGWMDRRTDGRMDGHTDVNTDFPCILQDIIPFGFPALPTS